jgi:uncharacterized membrane protein
MMASLQRNIIAGILIVVPIWVTVWAIKFMIDLLVQFGRPMAAQLAIWLSPTSPHLAALSQAGWFLDSIAVLVVLGALLFLGVVGRQVIGRQLLAAFDALMARIPLVQSIYGATRKLIQTMQAKPEGQQSVVLIEFPAPGMKAVGLLTRTFTSPETGEAIAAVYVPTTPNPSSGYVELVPAASLIPLTWTVNEALTFIISGGAVAPDSFAWSGPISNPELERRPA